MSGKASRRKGFGFEREVVNEAKSFGLVASRAWGSNGESLGYSKGTDVLIAGHPLQCKRVARLAERFKPGPDEYGVVMREDRGETLIVIRFDDWLRKLSSAHTALRGTDGEEK